VHQRGTGLSRDIPINESTIGIEHYTQDLELLRKARGDKKISLLGISWGGMLAMNYAATYPDFASNLILVCSGPPSYRLWNVLYDNQFARRSVAELDSMNRLKEIFSTKSERELDSLKMACPDCPEVLAYKEFILFHVRAMYYDRSKVSRALYEKEFYDFNFQVIPIIDKKIVESKFDIRDKLKQLTIPALIVYGRQDDQGESTFFEQMESLRFAEVHVIEQCGHEILEEKPVEFYQILMDYVHKKRN
jgi:proline iminopeptidase